MPWRVLTALRNSRFFPQLTAAVVTSSWAAVQLYGCGSNQRADSSGADTGESMESGRGSERSGGSAGAKSATAGGVEGSAGSGGIAAGSGGRYDASEPDAASADAAVADRLAGPEAASPTDTEVAASCPAGVAFCDDFEGYAAGSLGGRWHPVSPAPEDGTFRPGGKASSGFALTVDSLHAWSGTKAAHISVDYTGDGYASIYLGASSGITGDTAYARFMLYQTRWERPHPDTVPGIHDRMFFLGNVSVDFDFSPSVFVLEAVHDVFGPTAHMGPKPIPNRWICIKGQFGPRLSLTVDGMPVSAPAGGGKGLDSLALGMSSYRKFATDVWIDDLVVDTKPVDCPPP